MRKIYSYAILLVACALFGTLPVSAQSTWDASTTWDVVVPIVPDTTGVTLRKYVSEKDEATNTYTLTLESYATGSSVTTTTVVSKPVDIVLVLDNSGSMDETVTVITGRGSEVKSGTELKIGQVYIAIIDDAEYYVKGFSEETGRGMGARTTYYYMYKSGSVPTSNSDGLELYRGNNSLKYGTTTLTKTISELYTATTESKSRLILLQEAVASFLDVVKSDAATNEVEHHVGITLFGGDNNNTSVLSALNDASKNHSYDALKTSVNGIKSSIGGTPAHKAMLDAVDQLKTARELTVANRVVVFLTDGEPKNGVDLSNSRTTLSQEECARQAINTAYTIKTTYGASVFSIGMFSDATTLFRNYYLNNVSSNYKQTLTTFPTLSSTVKGTEDPHDYYQYSDGSDLSSVFEAIAQISTSGGSMKQLSAETTVAIDYLTSDFDLPFGADVDDIEVYVDELVNREKLTETTQTYTFGNRQTLAAFNGKSGNYVKLDTVKNVISVTGFDYTAADVDAINGPWGNWVGPRTANSTTIYKGRRLVITIPIRASVDYDGGFNLPTNTGDSGIYVIEKGDTTTINHYPVPIIDFPSIGIIKYGLKRGENACFTVQQVKEYNEDGDLVECSGTLYRVVLTATSNDVPAYAIIKDIPEGEYRVSENVGWSWTYKLDNIAVRTATGSETIENNNTFIGHILAKDAIVDWPDEIDETAECVLFTFTNSKQKTDAKDTFDASIYAESVVKNQFKGGKQTSTSNVTTNSKD